MQVDVAHAHSPSPIIFREWRIHGREIQSFSDSSLECDPRIPNQNTGGEKKALKAEPLDRTACSYFVFPPKQIDFQLLAPLTVEFTL